jgi:hypothetical protein
LNAIVIVALTAGCQQQPASGSQISLDGGLFSSNLVNITYPVNNTLPSYYYAPSGPFTLAAKVGIAVGSIVLILLVTGFFIVCSGKRRRRAHLRKLAGEKCSAPEPAWKEWNSPESETSRAFLHGGKDDSPMSARGSTPAFSPYVSPVSPEGGGKFFPPIPIPLPYDQRGKTEVRQTEQEMSNPNAIEMNQIRRASSNKIPIIKAPVPVVIIRGDSPPYPEASSSSEAKPELGVAL